MLGSKHIGTPMDYITKLRIVERSALVDKGRYQRLVRKLIYLSHIKPNIVFLVSMISEFINNPTKEHMKVMYRILRYFKMTLKEGLYSKEHRRQTLKIFKCKLGWLHN